jgi:trk system potassium uptake protein TrkA
MRIIVVGAGEVGHHITQHLAHEGHDVTVVDRDEARILKAEEELDAIVVSGNGASMAVLESAGAAKADMIIAVTNVDEVNIVACVSGKALGVPRRIARVKDLDYFAHRSGRSMHRVGVDIMVNPDLVSALEVERLVSLPGATDVTDFADARVRMVGLYVGEDSEVVGVALHELDQRLGPLPVTVVSILRDEKTIIPTGDTVMQAGDHVFVIGESWLMPDVMAMIGQDVEPARNVMIGGAGPVSRHLARHLTGQGVKVKIIESRRDKAERVARELENVMLFHGDTTDVALLEHEGVGSADAFIAATNDEETNVMSCLLARRLGAKKTIALIRRTNYVPLVPQVGIDAAVSIRMSTAAAIKQYFRSGAVLSFAQLKENDAEALEFLAREKSRIVRKPLGALGIPDGVVIGSVIRQGQVLVPRGSTQVEKGDRVVVFALPSAVDAVERLFD